MRVWLIIAIATAAMPQDVAAQAVPEGIHRYADGPAEMCGLVGRNASDLIDQARKSNTLQPRDIGSDRFELFESDPPTFQLVVTRPSELAHPAASCRHTFEQDGQVMMKRSLRCDAGRAECDALFLEFQALDDALTSALKGE